MCRCCYVLPCLSTRPSLEFRLNIRPCLTVITTSFMQLLLSLSLFLSLFLPFFLLSFSLSFSHLFCLFFVVAQLKILKRRIFADFFVYFRLFRFMAGRINGQYIMEGLSSSFLFCLGAFGLIALDSVRTYAFCVCMYACVSVCLYVYMYVCMFVCMYVCLYV